MLLILLVLVSSSLGLLLTRSVQATVVAAESGSEQIQAVRTLEQQWTSVAATVDHMLLTQQTSLIEEPLLGELASFNQTLADLTGQANLVADSNMATRLANLQAYGGDLDALVKDIVVLVEDGRWTQAQIRRLTELTSIQRRFDENIDQFSNLVEAQVATSVAESARLQTTLRISWIIAASVAVVGGLAVALLTVRSITQPVQALTLQIEQISQRDFSNITPLNRNDEIGKLSQSFAQMAEWLRESYEELENRVAQRTQALKASNEVSRSLSTILELDQLVIEVVEQIRTTFDYYHVHIYLFDEAQDKLVMVGGTGEAGAAMLASNHALAVSQGLVGQAFSHRKVTLIPDVSQDANWLPNPLLPGTKAEIAVPIAVADEVLGVLDVQHDAPNGLTELDADLLQGIANQVAIAVQNAHSYQHVQKQRQYEAIAGQIGAKIQLAASVEDVLQVAVRELASALNVSRVEAALQNSRQLAGQESA